MQTPLKSCFTNLPTTLFLKCSGVPVGLIFVHITNASLSFAPKSVFSLAVVLSIKDTSVCMFPPTVCMFLRTSFFDESVFPFSRSPSVPVSAPHESSPVSVDQFADVAYSPLLLPNHGAGTGRGARLKLLVDSAPPDASTSAHDDRVDHHPMQTHAWTESAASPSPPGPTR